MAKKKPKPNISNKILLAMGFFTTASTVGLAICGGCPKRFFGCILYINKLDPKLSLNEIVEYRKYEVSPESISANTRKSLLETMCIRKRLPLAGSGQCHINEDFVKEVKEYLGDYEPPPKYELGNLL